MNAASTSVVIDLSALRARRRLATYRAKLAEVIATNRRAIDRLYRTGTLFTRSGARVGRDLLLAHQHLLRVSTLLERLSDQGDVPAPLTSSNQDVVYGELDRLLGRSATLTERTGKTLDRLCPS